MKKFMIAALAVFFIVSFSHAMSVIAPPSVVTISPDVLTPDNPSWTGTQYNGVPAKYSGTTIGANVNYFSELNVQYGKITVRTPGSTAAATVQDGAFIRLVLRGNGAVSYKAVKDNFNAWNKMVTPNAAPIAKFEDSGIVFNSFNHQDTAFSQYTIKCDPTPCKNYPEWTVYITVNMTLADYNNIFAPGFSSWNSTYHIFGTPSSNPITGNGMSGTLLIYKKI